MKKGQSLIEVTVALSIVGLTLLGLITLGINVIGYSLSSKARTQAVALAQQGIEAVRNEGGCCRSIGYYKLGSEKNIESVTAEPFDVSVPSFIDFRREIYITTATDTQVPSGVDETKYWYVTSKVTWELRGTQDGEVTVYGLLSKNN